MDHGSMIFRCEYQVGLENDENWMYSELFDNLLFGVPNCVNLSNQLLSAVCCNIHIVSRFNHSTAYGVILLIIVVSIIT